jgi:hypothetical protein
MTKPWTRDDTKEWIIQLEHRLEDIDFYLNRTVEWCENHGVWDDEKVFTLSFITVLWVANMRGEDVSKRELLEILGIQGWDAVDDLVYELSAESKNLDYEELLLTVLDRFDD